MPRVSNVMEDLHFLNCAGSSFIAANEDMFNGDPATDVLSMKNADEIHFLIAKNAGATGTATITVESCDDTTPSNTTAVAFQYRAQTTIDTWGAWQDAAATGFTTTAGADQLYQVRITQNGLSSTDAFVRLKATEVVDSACDGAIIAFAVPRVAKEVPTSILS